MNTQCVHYKKLALQDSNGRETSDFLGIMSLNRPETANAFNAEMILSITETLRAVKADSSLRVLLIHGVGKHFSAGADLAWMKTAQGLSYEDNQKDAEKLIDMFESLADLPIPSVAIVKGAAFGGAVGLIACCDHVIVCDNAKLSLSEVRVGILPAVILPYLARKIPQGTLKSLAISGRVFDSNEAFRCHLAQETSTVEHLIPCVHEALNQLLMASGDAQFRLKLLMHHVSEHHNRQGTYTAKVIADARTSPHGQEGLSAFLEKRKPSWIRTIQVDALTEALS